MSTAVLDHHKPALTPQGGRAVMNRRLDPRDSLDFFPTPPWATRALLKHAISDATGLAWDPCAGEGHMSDVLAEHFECVHASDVFDYGRAHAIGSFIGAPGSAGRAVCLAKPDWVIFNPPFNAALDFAERALDETRRGVAVLVRSVWSEGGQRYKRLFSTRPPSTIAQFCERVPMVEGCWDPAASTATSYAWYIWDRACVPGTIFKWIAPGCRTSLTKPDDIARFAAWTLEPPPTPDELASASAMRRNGVANDDIRAALGVSRDRMTRIRQALKAQGEWVGAPAVAPKALATEAARHA